MSVQQPADDVRVGVSQWLMPTHELVGAIASVLDRSALSEGFQMLSFKSAVVGA